MRNAVIFLIIGISETKKMRIVYGKLLVVLNIVLHHSVFVFVDSTMLYDTGNKRANTSS